MKMKSFVKEWHTKFSIGERGWGNGYVLIPEDHPLYGKHYDDINEYVEVHGGLTFSNFSSNLGRVRETPEDGKNYWVVGFDTVHCDDTRENWPKERVLKETESLKEQLINYAKKEKNDE